MYRRAVFANGEAPDDAEALMVFLKMNFSYLKEE